MRDFFLILKEFFFISFPSHMLNSECLKPLGLLTHYDYVQASLSIEHKLHALLFRLRLKRVLYCFFFGTEENFSLQLFQGRGTEYHGFTGKY